MFASTLSLIGDNGDNMDEFNVENEREFLTSLESILGSTENNLQEFIDDIPQIFAAGNLEYGSCNGEIQRENAFLSVDESKDDVTTLRLECEELRVRVEHVTREKEAALEEVERLKDQSVTNSDIVSFVLLRELFSRCKPLEHSFAYVLHTTIVKHQLSWRTTFTGRLIRLYPWNSYQVRFQNKIGEFLSIVSGSFDAFVDTYKSAFPPTSNVEYQFVMGLLGIVTNVSASPEGREFLITNSNGMEFVRKIVKLTPELPLAPGSSSLKRLMLMILYNVSMNKTGLQYLLELHVGDTLSHCLEVEEPSSEKKASEEMQLLCLRVLQSVTYDLTKPEYIRDLVTKIPIERIETMTFAPRSDISDAAKQVVGHLRDGQRILVDAS